MSEPLSEEESRAIREQAELAAQRAKTGFPEGIPERQELFEIYFCWLNRYADHVPRLLAEVDRLKNSVRVARRETRR